MRNKKYFIIIILIIVILIFTSWLFLPKIICESSKENIWNEYNSCCCGLKCINLRYFYLFEPNPCSCCYKSECEIRGGICSDLNLITETCEDYGEKTLPYKCGVMAESQTMCCMKNLEDKPICTSKELARHGDFTKDTIKYFINNFSDFINVDLFNIELKCEFHPSIFLPNYSYKFYYSKGIYFFYDYNPRINQHGDFSTDLTILIINGSSADYVKSDYLNISENKPPKFGIKINDKTFCYETINNNLILGLSISSYSGHPCASGIPPNFPLNFTYYNESEYINYIINSTQ